MGQRFGLYYLRARYYNPATGRFMSRDPQDNSLLNPNDLHKYLYANGDPINGIDPLGRDDFLEYQMLTWRRETLAAKTFAKIGWATAACYTDIAGLIVAAMEHSSLGTTIGVGGAFFACRDIVLMLLETF